MKKDLLELHNKHYTKKAFRAEIEDGTCRFYVEYPDGSRKYDYQCAGSDFYRDALAYLNLRTGKIFGEIDA